MCTHLPVQLANDSVANVSGLDAPVAHVNPYGALGQPSRILYAAYGSDGRQTLLQQPLPRLLGPSPLISTLVDIPGSDLTFTGFTEPYGGTSDAVVFIGEAHRHGEASLDGVFLLERALAVHLPPRKLVDTRTAIPPVPGEAPLPQPDFLGLGSPVLLADGSGDVVFAGADEPGGRRSGLFRWRRDGGAIETVVENVSSRVADISGAAYAAGERASAGHLVYLATAWRRGVRGPGLYSQSLQRGLFPPVPRLLTAVGEPVPQSAPAQRFAALGAPGAAGSWVAFVGAGSAGTVGVYACNVNSGACRRVVDSRSKLPGGGSIVNFEGTPSVAADGTVVFMADASNASQSGVYGADVAVSGDVWPVVAMGDAFTYLRARGTGWDGRCLAFYAITGDADAVLAVDGRSSRFRR